MIAVNLGETPDVVGQYVQVGGLTLPVLLDQDGVLAEQLGVTYLPTTFFVDETGIIRGRLRRMLTVDEMQQAVQALHTPLVQMR